MTAKETYLELIKSKQAKGLKDVKFFSAEVFDVQEEDFYAELNRLHAAPDLPDVEVLGQYSPKV